MKVFWVVYFIMSTIIWLVQSEGRAVIENFPHSSRTSTSVHNDIVKVLEKYTVGIRETAENINTTHGSIHFVNSLRPETFSKTTSSKGRKRNFWERSWGTFIHQIHHYWWREVGNLYIHIWYIYILTYMYT